MKTVQDKDGNVIEVTIDTPCHAGKDGRLPVMLDVTLDATIFNEMAAKEVTATIKKVDYIANHKYKDDRQRAYAPIGEQFDMIYWDQVNGTTTFKDHITQVKLDNPKPKGEK